MLENMKALRKQNHLKQSEFGELFGIKNTTYSNYELGGSEPPLVFFKAVADYFQVSVDYLLDMTDNPKGSKYGEAFPTSEQEKAIVRAWREAEEKDRRRVAIDLEDYGFSYQQNEKADAG